MWVELITAGILLADYAYHRWIEDHPKEPLPPGSQIPRVDEGAPIPLIYGTVRVRTPVMVWGGNYYVPGQVVHAGALGDVANGSWYFFDALFAIGTSVAPPSLIRVWAGDTPMVMNISGSGPPYRFNAGTLPTSNDQLAACGVFYDGNAFQDVADNTPSGVQIAPPLDIDHQFVSDGTRYDLSGQPNGTTSALAAMRFSGQDTAKIPGYRGQVVAFMHVKTGSAPDVPGFGFELRAPAALTGGFWTTSADADPAAVIKDILIRSGVPASLIDDESFIAASETLATEQHGYSMAIEQPRDAIEVVDDILKQIDGVRYTDQVTGKVALALVRKISDPSTLDDINPSNCDSLDDKSYTVQGWAEIPNQVRVTYQDRDANYASATKVAQDQGSLIASGNVVRPVAVAYDGVKTAALALKLAARELAARTRPMVRVTVRVDRRFASKHVGEAVTFTWPDLGVDHMVMRIARINRGRPGSSRVTLDLLRDVTDSPTVAFPS